MHQPDAVTALATLAPTFGKGLMVTFCAFLLFVGSIYIFLAAIFGRRMGYFVLATAFFAWMTILSGLWVVGSWPLKVGEELATLQYLGPRGTEPHWQILAAGSGDLRTAYAETSQYPGPAWKTPKPTDPSISTLTTAVQSYLAAQAAKQLNAGQAALIQPSQFVVQNPQFATSGDTSLGVVEAFNSSGGPAVTVFAYHDRGNVPVYSYVFLIVSIIGFAIHLPFLDRLERGRKEVLTGGHAPPWYGPA